MVPARTMSKTNRGIHIKNINQSIAEEEYMELNVKMLMYS